MKIKRNKVVFCVIKLLLHVKCDCGMGPNLNKLSKHRQVVVKFEGHGSTNANFKQHAFFLPMIILTGDMLSL